MHAICRQYRNPRRPGVPTFAGGGGALGPQHPGGLAVAGEVAHLEVADGEAHDGGLVQLAGDGAGQGQHLGQLVELEVLLPAPRPRRVARLLLPQRLQAGGAGGGDGVRGAMGQLAPPTGCPGRAHPLSRAHPRIVGHPEARPNLTVVNPAAKGAGFPLSLIVTAIKKPHPPPNLLPPTKKWGLTPKMPCVGRELIDTLPLPRKEARGSG